MTTPEFMSIDQFIKNKPEVIIRMTTLEFMAIYDKVKKINDLCEEIEDRNISDFDDVALLMEASDSMLQHAKSFTKMCSDFIWRTQL